MESTRSDVLILGGGFAGLACGVALAERGLKVTIVEKKPHLGGRAYSFTDGQSSAPVDNGQHLFMGCYHHTRRFLRTIGTEGLLKFPSKIRVDYVDTSGARAALSCPTFLGAPWHLVLGILGLRGISLSDKWNLRRIEKELHRFGDQDILPAELDRLTVRDWLDSLGQSRRVQQRFFDPIALGALNDDPAVAAATGFAQVLQEIFFRDTESTRLGLSSVGLSDLYTQAARSFIESRGGRVILSRKIAGLIEEDGRVAGAVTETGERLPARETVSTLPPWDLSRLELPSRLRGDWEKLKPASIVSINLWLDQPLLQKEPFVGLLGTEIQWVFNKGEILGRDSGREHYLSLVISGAHSQVSLDPKTLQEIALRDLSRCFPGFQRAKIKRWKIVKEPFATLSPVPGSDALRPEAGSGMPGFYFAGDWTKTGLPATIESAVLSGHKAAEMVLKEGKSATQAAQAN